MKNKWSKENIIKQFIEGGEKIREAQKKGDYKTNNKEIDKIAKIAKYLKQDSKMAEEVLTDLLNKKLSPETRRMVAVTCFKLHIYEEKAEDMLIELVEGGKKYGVTGWFASMELMAWRQAKGENDSDKS